LENILQNNEQKINFLLNWYYITFISDNFYWLQHIEFIGGTNFLWKMLALDMVRFSKRVKIAPKYSSLLLKWATKVEIQVQFALIIIVCWGNLLNCVLK